MTKLLLAVLAIAALLFAACGDDNGDDGDNGGDGAPQTTATQPATAPAQPTAPTLPDMSEIDPNAPAAGIPEVEGEVITTPSGLQYIIIEQGSGAMPTATQTVTVHYNGWTTDGLKFDSSLDRGQPAQFRLDRVIDGWTEGLQYLQEGGEIRLIVPSDLAYGPQGRPPVIPPNADLIFDVQLLGVR